MAKAPAQAGAAGKQGSLYAEEGRSLHSLQMQAWPWLWWATAKDYPDCKTAAGKWSLQQRNMATLSRVRDITKKMVILIRFAREGKPACVLGLFCMHTYAKRKISLTQRNSEILYREGRCLITSSYFLHYWCCRGSKAIKTSISQLQLCSMLDNFQPAQEAAFHQQISLCKAPWAAIGLAVKMEISWTCHVRAESRWTSRK